MSLPFVDRIPLPDHVLKADQTISFTLDGSVILSSVLFSINDVVIYSNSTAHGGYTVTRTPLFGDQTRYEITPPDYWPYNARLVIGVYAEQDAWWYRWFTGMSGFSMDAYGEGEPMGVIRDVWNLYVEEDPSCFFGPINRFEQSLLFPYTSYASTLQFTEQLRSLLLDQAISRPQANRAVRWLFLRAHSHDLAPILRSFVPAPTTVESTVRLCNQRSNVDIDAALRNKPTLLSLAIDELRSFGLPAEHADLLHRYDVDDPNLRVPASCLTVCLAKVLEAA
jgi:hypothetical protein